ncbi:hypothetical protein N431DRAFT_500028 [Stipitochalara longipes BDJ]|nr:hypothetical protein N431DRAFT_500028 [Stipitochalara longipes BDJ]
MGIPRARSLTRLEAFQAIATKYFHPWNDFKHRREERRKIKKPPQKNAPFMLRFWGLLLLLAVEFLILIVITALWILTTRHNGFADVPDTPASIIVGSTDFHERLLWIYSLLWTFLPAFIITICKALFAAALQALEHTQSMIELRKQTSASGRDPSSERGIAGCFLPFWSRNTTRRTKGKAEAKHTILLDYGREWFPFIDSYHAFKNQHFLISVCTVVRWFLAAIGPLAAAIISVGNVSSFKPIEVTTSTFFDEYKNESSSRLAFDSVSAILLNSASPLPWSTEMYSVVPFSAQSDIPGNLSSDTGTYSGTLDCVSIDVDTLKSAGNVTLDYQNTTTFNFVDRGCSANILIDASPNPSLILYAQTNYQECSYDARVMRLVLTIGSYDPPSTDLPTNISLISCIPYFWKSTSHVSVRTGANNLRNFGQILDIVPDTASVKSWLPSFWNKWMFDLPNYRVEDPEFVFEADNFAFITYHYAMNSNGTINFAQAMNATFGVFFATFATLSTYSVLPENITSTGMLSRPGNRLFVVFLPAIIVTFVMALSFIVTIWIALYAYQHREILKEHMDLVLGHAILLKENEGVNDYIDAVRAEIRGQAEKAAEATTNKQAEKAGQPRSEVSRDLLAEHLVLHGDLVQFAKETSDLKEWNCSVDDTGKFMVKRSMDP